LKRSLPPPTLPPRRLRKISGVYKIKGVGDVLAGHVEQGIVKPGDEVEFLPTHTASNPCTGKVFTVEMHHQRAEQAKPGDNVGLNIKGLDKVKQFCDDTTVEANEQIEVLKDIDQSEDDNHWPSSESDEDSSSSTSSQSTSSSESAESDVQMDADGGKAKYGNAGAKYDMGYCDAQCPHDLKLINGQANDELVANLCLCVESLCELVDAPVAWTLCVEALGEGASRELFPAVEKKLACWCESVDEEKTKIAAHHSN